MQYFFLFFQIISSWKCHKFSIVHTCLMHLNDFCSKCSAQIFSFIFENCKHAEFFSFLNHQLFQLQYFFHYFPSYVHITYDWMHHTSPQWYIYLINLNKIRILKSAQLFVFIFVYCKHVQFFSFN